jgi:hypothetical protein
MLIKYWDRLTIDGFLAARAARASGDHAPLKELLKLVAGQGVRQGELPFSADPAEALRFDGGTFLELDPENASLCSSISDLKTKPDDLSSFMAGEAHETLAFTDKAIVTGLFPRAVGGPRLLSVHEGRTGRKYARTKSEIVNFLMHHPAKDDLLSDIAMRYRLDSELRTGAQLEHFLDEAPDDRLDELIDAAAMLKGYLFDPKAFGPLIADKSAWFFEFDKKSRAVLDFVVHPARGYAATLAAFADADKDLAAALKDVLAFAKKAGVSADAGGFLGALRILEDGLPSPHPFWKLCGLDADRQRLLAAALASDQFAGMGSWNDVQIEKDTAYRLVSNRVVYALVQAICSATAPA